MSIIGWIKKSKYIKRDAIAIMPKINPAVVANPIIANKSRHGNEKILDSLLLIDSLAVFNASNVIGATVRHKNAMM